MFFFNSAGLRNGEPMSPVLYRSPQLRFSSRYQVNLLHKTVNTRIIFFHFPAAILKQPL